MEEKSKKYISESIDEINNLRAEIKKNSKHLNELFEKYDKIFTNSKFKPENDIQNYTFITPDMNNDDDKLKNMKSDINNCISDSFVKLNKINKIIEKSLPSSSSLLSPSSSLSLSKKKNIKIGDDNNDHDNLHFQDETEHHQDIQNDNENYETLLLSNEELLNEINDIDHLMKNIKLNTITLDYKLTDMNEKYFNIDGRKDNNFTTKSINLNSNSDGLCTNKSKSITEDNNDIKNDNENIKSNLNETNNKKEIAMENFKTSYSPEEFFKAVMMKNIAEFSATTTTTAKTTTAETTATINVISESSRSLISPNTTNTTPILASSINLAQSTTSTSVENNQSINTSSSSPSALESLKRDNKINKSSKLNNDETDEFKSYSTSPPSTSTSTRHITNTFSYSNPEEFIKAVVKSNPSQATYGFSSKNALIFEDFYKNKLINCGKSTEGIFQEQKNMQIKSLSSTSTSPLPAFKSAIDALPKIYGNSGNIQQTHQNNEQQNLSQNQIKNNELKTKISKVKEKFAKLSMKKSTNLCQLLSATSDQSEKRQNFHGSSSSLSSLKSQKNQKESNFQDNNYKINACNIQNTNVNNEKNFVVETENKQKINQKQNSCYKDIHQTPQLFKQPQLAQNRYKVYSKSLSRSVSESAASITSLIFDNQSIVSLSSRNSINDESVASSSKTKPKQQRQEKEQQKEQFFSKSTHSIDHAMSEEVNLKNKSLKKRQRGKRGGGGGRAHSENEENEKFHNSENSLNNSNNDTMTIKKLDYPHLNAETLLILDLLSFPTAEQKEKYLFKLAIQKNILIENQNTNKNTTTDTNADAAADTYYELHPVLEKHYKSILKPPLYYDSNKNCKKHQNLFTEDEKKRLKIIFNQIEENLKEKKNQKDKGKEKQVKYYEDYVNEIIHENLTNPEQIKEFTFSKQRNRSVNYFKKESFTKIIEEFAKKCVNAGLGEIIEGEIRINAKNNDQAFMKHVYNERDAMFSSQLIRKCALQGDIVRAFICKVQPQSLSSHPSSSLSPHPTQSQSALTTATSQLEEIAPLVKDENENMQDEIGPSDKNEINLSALIEDNDIEGDDEIILPEKSCKGFVIDVIKEVHNRKCVGTFLSYRKGSDFITFIPRDMKMPVLKIFKKNWPESILNNTTNLQNVADILYAAEIIEWRDEVCIGKILHPIGKCNELDSENKAILYQNNLQMDEFDEKFNKMFYGPLIITEDEIKKRKDLRNECIFTIDPLTARDLDDALSCKILSDNLYEIGVHISDVSYFLEENTELDKLVSERTTSVYMVNEVFHMLPKSLCYKCSLLPGEDKLAYSIFWIMNANGEVKNFNIERTIINSCTQFAYEHAQKIIDNPNHRFTENDFPSIHNNFTIDDIRERILIMHRIAENLRKKRFDNGALKINKPKLSFELSPQNGEPTNFNVYELKTANFMIEEYMLLANQYIAQFIYDKYPKISILRSHEPPIKNLMKTLKDRLLKFGLNFDITSSKAIYHSLKNLIDSSAYPDAMEICLSHLVSKPMKRARYFCSESAKSEQDFWHYALSIPIYTHFTSPIRRYPDIMVHRVLSAALDYMPEPIRKPDELHYIAAVCNEKKYNAKMAGEDSSNLYFKHYIKSKKSVTFRAAVLQIFGYAMEVILIETGHIIRINLPRERENKGYKVNVDTSKLPYTAILQFNTVENVSCDQDKNNEMNEICNIDQVNIENMKQSNGKKIIYPPIELKMFAEILIEVSFDANDRLKGSISLPAELKKVQLNSVKNNKSKKSNRNCITTEENIEPSARKQIKNELEDNHKVELVKEMQNLKVEDCEQKVDQKRNQEFDDQNREEQHQKEYKNN